MGDLDLMSSRIAQLFPIGDIKPLVISTAGDVTSYYSVTNVVSLRNNLELCFSEHLIQFHSFILVQI